ncbi:hypothetical protein N7451_007318 [Penicillium sp. IBT 35674x]|nr:hypothetical protein N7451_007318 [Penicillium sp. IBT 35674x]
MALSNDNPAMVFYDIAFRPPFESTPAAPNPWKARYALNMKGVPYKTQWVQMPDIATVRQKVGAPACRKFADGTDYYTLPMLTDSTTNSVLGDSFDIALYLQKQYPSSGTGDLFPTQTLDFKYEHGTAFVVPLSEREEGECGEYVRFNRSVDSVFTAHVMLMAPGMQFDPAHEEAIQAMFAKRAGVETLPPMEFGPEDRARLMVSLRDALADLVKLLNRNETGPFILGQHATYADCIVGGWLRMMKMTLPASEWEKVMGWYGGALKRFYVGLEQFTEVK